MLCRITSLKMGRHFLRRHDFISSLTKILKGYCPYSLSKKIRHRPQSLTSVSVILSAHRMGYTMRNAPSFDHWMQILMLTRVYFSFGCKAIRKPCSSRAQLLQIISNRNIINASNVIDEGTYVCTENPCTWGGKRPFIWYREPVRKLTKGGARIPDFVYTEIKDYLLPGSEKLIGANTVFKFVDQVDDIGILQYPLGLFVHAKIPVHEIIPHVSLAHA